MTAMTNILYLGDQTLKRQNTHMRYYHQSFNIILHIIHIR